MNIVVLEDERDIRQQIVSTITQVINENNSDEISKNKIVLETDSPARVLSYAENHTEDTVYFLDIKVNTVITGIEVAKKIRENDIRSYIVFLTNHSEQDYMIFKYKLQVLDFILKSTPDLLSRIRECLQQAHRYNNMDSSNYLIIETKMGIKKIQFSTIYTIQAVRQTHKICVYATDLIKEFNMGIGEVFNKLDKRFHYCHRSYIVNLDHVVDINILNRSLVLDNGVTCQYSRNYIKNIREKLSNRFLP